MYKRAGLKGPQIRIPIHFPEAMIKFMEDIGREASTSGGFKIHKSECVRASVHVMMKLYASKALSVKGVKLEEELTARILKALRGKSKK